MEKFSDFINRESDRCVKCGLCLPYCPTYDQTGHEGESPRGRIALLQGIAANKIAVTSSAENYLDHCLSCGACEEVCPAGVPYEKLMTAGRALLAEKKTCKITFKNLFKKFILFLTPKLYLIRPSFKKYPLPKTLPEKSASIALLPGCIHSFFEKQVLIDSIRILNYLNINFTLLNAFKCCGGLHAHAGDDKNFEKLRLQNKFLFEKFDTVLSTASGCTSILNQHFKNISSIENFLNNFKYKFNDRQKSYQQTILIHKPCTAKNRLDFIKNIPKIKLQYLKNTYCCGASGTYFLEYADKAESLANSIIQEVSSAMPDVFVTQNIGCAIHLKRQFKKNNISIKIQHPVNILASRLFA